MTSKPIVSFEVWLRFNRALGRASSGASIHGTLARTEPARGERPGIDDRWSLAYQQLADVVPVVLGLKGNDEELVIGFSQRAAAPDDALAAARQLIDEWRTEWLPEWALSEAKVIDAVTLSSTGRRRVMQVHGDDL